MVLNKSVIRNQTVALSAKPEIDEAESSLKTEKEDDQKNKKTLKIKHLLMSKKITRNNYGFSIKEKILLF